MRTPSTDASALAGCAAFQTLRLQASPIPLQGENTAYWRCWDARKQSTRCNATQRVVVYLLDLSRASVFNVTPIMSLWDSRVSRQSGDRKVNAF